MCTFLNDKKRLIFFFESITSKTAADIASLFTRGNELSRSFFFHSIVHPSSLRSLLPHLEILIYLLVFKPPPNSPAYPHELTKISVFRIIRPFPLSNIDSIFTSITRLYTPPSIVTLISIVYMYIFLLNHFTFLRFNRFCLCIYLFSLRATICNKLIVIVKTVKNYSSPKSHRTKNYGMTLMTDGEISTVKVGPWSSKEFTILIMCTYIYASVCLKIVKL